MKNLKIITVAALTGIGTTRVLVWANFKEPCVGQCYMPKKSLYNIWVEKLVALCSATGREAPKFITDKAGECW